MRDDLEISSQYGILGVLHVATRDLEEMLLDGIDFINDQNDTKTGNDTGTSL